MVVVEPSQQCIGNRFPLLRYIDIGEQLAAGNWMVAIIDRDCGKCKELLKLLDDGGTSAKLFRRLRLTIVELHGQRDGPWSTSCNAAQIGIGKLDTQFEWFVTTPLVVQLQDGVVVWYGDDFSGRDH